MTHPWQTFLDARVQAIEWMKNELKYTDDQIAKVMTMDEKQIQLVSLGMYVKQNPIPVTDKLAATKSEIAKTEKKK